MLKKNVNIISPVVVAVLPMPEFCFGQMGGRMDGQTMSNTIVADRPAEVTNNAVYIAADTDCECYRTTSNLCIIMVFMQAI